MSDIIGPMTAVATKSRQTKFHLSKYKLLYKLTEELAKITYLTKFLQDPLHVKNTPLSSEPQNSAPPTS